MNSLARATIPARWRHGRARASTGTMNHPRSYHELSFSRHGEPLNVLEYRETKTQPGNEVLGEKRIQVDMIHVPWNPADANNVQGTYASPYSWAPAGIEQPSSSSQHFPGRSVSGSEGWGRVVASESSNVPVGSLVTLARSGLGTLRSSLTLSENDVLQVPSDLFDQLGPAGSTLLQLGGTALRMLTDFVRLQPGDLVIQNAGNSGVGLMVSQLAPAAFGAPVVSVVRRGSKSTQEMDELKEYLTTVGKNAMVLVEEDLEDSSYRQEVQGKLKVLSASGQLPNLALNAVGGDSATMLMRLLEDGGSLVTYGGMSGKPVTVATPQLIFKDFRVVGYWQSRWMVQNDLPAKQVLVDQLVEAVREKGVVCPPCKVFPLRDALEALKWQSSEQSAIRHKLVFDCR